MPDPSFRLMSRTVPALTLAVADFSGSRTQLSAAGSSTEPFQEFARDEIAVPILIYEPDATGEEIRNKPR